MEQFYKDPHTLARMREGPLGAYVDAFAQQLSDEGYPRASGRYALQVVADFGCWLSQHGLVVPQLTAEYLDCYLGCQSGHRHRRSGDAAILRRLFAVLIEKGIVVPEPASESTPVEQLAQEFRLYLERERGLAPPTVFYYLEFTRRFLVQCFADGEPRLDGLRAADVVLFVQREAARLGKSGDRPRFPALHARFDEGGQAKACSLLYPFTPWSVPVYPTGDSHRLCESFPVEPR